MSMSPGPARHLQRVGGARPPGIVDIDPGGDRTIEWLSAGDPSVRWQVMRDLLGRPRGSGGGRACPGGHRRGGVRSSSLPRTRMGAGPVPLYSPKWTSTTYTLLLLERLGLERGACSGAGGVSAAVGGCALVSAAACNLAKSIREPETCITGMLVLLAAAFGHDDPRLDSDRGVVGGRAARRWWLELRVHPPWLESRVVPHVDHGVGGAVGLRAQVVVRFPSHQRWWRAGSSSSITGSTGRIGLVRWSIAAFARFPFPPQWHFDIMRGLEHFRACRGRPRRASRRGRRGGPPGETSRWQVADVSAVSGPLLVRARSARGEPLVDAACHARAGVVGRTESVMTSRSPG